MLRIILSVLIIGCVLIGSKMSVNAENKLTAPFKAPFSIFSDKKEKNEQEKTNKLNVQTEKKIKTNGSKQLIKVYDPDNTIGIAYIENTIKKAEFYLEEGDFDSAGQELNHISEWVYDATEYHTDLFKTLKNVENSDAQANIERDLAIQFAVLRDKTLFLESKVNLANGNKKQAVQKLVEVVRSQPSTDLGFKAYEKLQEIGFTYKIKYEMLQEEKN